MQLANFERVLADKKSEVGYHQVWRWLKANRMPKLITWLAEQPELAEALAEDARAMGNERATVAQEVTKR